MGRSKNTLRSVEVVDIVYRATRLRDKETKQTHPPCPPTLQEFGFLQGLPVIVTAF